MADRQGALAIDCLPGPGREAVSGAVPASVVAATRRTGRSAQRTVRRLIVYALLFVLVVIAATGLGGLLGRLAVTGSELIADDVSGLALSLAFTLIGAPLALLLWWAVWRRLGEGAERSSVAWALYVAGIYVLSLLIAASSILGAMASLVGGEQVQWRLSLAAGVAWAAVWAWHVWIVRHGLKSPTRLAGVPAVLGSVLGLVIGVGGAVSALALLFDAALLGAGASVGRPWWLSGLQTLIWATGGSLLWWWHWKYAGVRRLRGGLADVALITAGVLGAGILALGGAGVALFVVLRLLFDPADAIEILLEPLGPAVAAAAVGSIVWVYHRGIARERPGSAGHGGRLVTSGVALVAAASGVGVIVNATLAITTAPLAGSGVRSLLLGGISSLAVGGPVWWLAWRPRDQTRAGEPWLNARRVYLLAVFGLSAVAAVITLLVIGFRLFEFALDDVFGGSLIDRIRAPLGLLAATGLAAGYHFAAWRRDREILAAAGQPRQRNIGHVILVTGSDSGPLQRAIGEATGAGVTVWARADAGDTAGNGAEAAGPGGMLETRLIAALAGVSGNRVLVIVAPDGSIETIPLLG
ncbi:MAG: DUF5671 domain-containing protein [Arthrobacter oryzae]